MNVLAGGMRHFAAVCAACICPANARVVRSAFAPCSTDRTRLRADIPARYGPHTTCVNRFNRWRKAGVWDRLLDSFDPVGSSNHKRHHFPAKPRAQTICLCAFSSASGVG
jgi:hypothetical protein